MGASLAQRIRDGYRRAMFVAGGSALDVRRMRRQLRDPALAELTPQLVRLVGRQL